MSESSEVKPKNITLGLILGWIVGVVLLISGIVGIFSSMLPSIFIILAALVVIPSVSQWVAKILKFRLSGVLRFFIFIILIAVAIGFMESDKTDTTATPIIPTTTTVTETSAQTQTVQQKTSAPKPAPVVKPTPTPTPISQTSNQNTPPVSNVTVSQKNALRAAQSYLNYAPFSHDGLVAQLEYEKFSHADAVYGADNSGANWNEQAAKTAKQYMSYSAFSRGSLIEQLEYDKYTRTQAEYGANAVGL